MHIDDLHDLHDAACGEERRTLALRMDDCCRDCGWEPDDCLCYLSAAWHIAEDEADLL